MKSHYQRIKGNTRLVFSEAMNAVRHGFSDGHETSLRPLAVARLERRIMMSASPIAVMQHAGAISAVDSADNNGQPNMQLTVDGSADVSPRRAAEETSTDTSSGEVQSVVEFVVIDPSADDYEAMVADLQLNSERAFEVLVLDPRKDGIVQITEALKELKNVSAIHLVSHGDEGELLLGTGVLSQRTMDQYSDEMSSWHHSMTANAELLVYGCDLAATQSGRDLLDSLSVVTKADLAASVDNTGHAILGGDWDLEYSTGDIETDVAFSRHLQQNWGHLLNVTIDATTTSTAAALAASDSVSHTTTGSDRLMLVGISFGQDKGDNVASVTHNGTPLALVGARDNGVALGSRVEIWSLVAPDAGTHDVVVNFSGTSHRGATIGIMTFNGVDQSTALGNFASAEGNSSAPSTNVSSASNELVFGVLGLDDNADTELMPGGGQAEHWDLWQDRAAGGGTTETGAASVAASWSLAADSKWAAGGVSIKPSGNSAPTITSSTTPSLAENTAAVMTITATDPDSDPITFSITGGLDQARFSINSTTGDLSFDVAPDFEIPTDFGSNNVYRVRVTADDGLGGSHEQLIAATVLAVNDNPPVVNTNQSFTLWGDVLHGAMAGRVTASDADAGTDFNSWAITSGNAAGIFSIDTDTGRIVISDDSAIAFDQTSTYLLGVVVSDGMNTSDPKTITVTIPPRMPAPAVPSQDDRALETVAETPSESGPETDTSDTEKLAENVLSPPPVAVAGGVSLEVTRSHESQVPQQASDQETLNDGGVLRDVSQAESEFTTNVLIDFSGTEHVSTRTPGNESPGRDLPSVTETNRLSAAAPVSLTSRHLATSLAATGRTSIDVALMKRDMHAQLNFDDTVVSSVATVGSGLAAGYAVWAVRGGMLLSGLLAQMPVWTMLDPLLIVDRVGTVSGEGDSLAEIVDRQNISSAECSPYQCNEASDFPTEV